MVIPFVHLLLEFSHGHTNLIIYSANTQDSIQLLVTGFKLVQSLENGKINVYYNGTTVNIDIWGTFNTTSGEVGTITTISSQYAPKNRGNVYTLPYPASNTEKVMVNSNGQIQYYPGGSNKQIYATLRYSI